MGCPAGRYPRRQSKQASLPPAAFRCAYCPEGKYSARFGLQGCHLCARGRYSTTLIGRRNCLACAPGHYSSDAGLPFCRPCARGFRQPRAAQAFCLDDAQRYCPVGRMASRAGTAEARCGACPAGRFGALSALDGRAGCVHCAKGRFSARSGAAACRKCAPGHLSRDDRVGCTACAPGRFFARRDSVEVVLGAERRIVDSRCFACAVGQFQSYAAQLHCRRCAAGRSTQLEGQRACERERERAAATVPAPAAAAATAVPTTAAPTAVAPCGAGRYAAQPGPCAACGPCAAVDGRAMFRTGCGGTHVGTCTPCGPGRYARRSACWGCSAGFREGCAQCSSCAAGRARALCGGASGGTCEPCAPGRFKATRGRFATACEPCEQGTGQLAPAQVNCYPTPSPTPLPTPSPSAPLPTPVPPPPPEVQPRPPATAHRLLLCPAGQFAQEVEVHGGTRRQQACFDCPAGRYEATQGARSACKACPFGWGSPPEAVATAVGASARLHCVISCPAGQEAVPGSVTACRLCPAGKSRNAAPAPASSIDPGDETCTACAAGRAQPLAGRASCGECPAGKRANARSAATACVWVHSDCLRRCFRPRFASPCAFFAFAFTSCVSFRRCSAAEWRAARAKCDAAGCAPAQCGGKRQSARASGGALRHARAQTRRGALVCPRGRYAYHSSFALYRGETNAEKRAQVLCMSCPPGKFGGARHGACEHCPGGQFAAAQASKRCAACPGGQQPASDHGSCKKGGAPAAALAGGVAGAALPWPPHPAPPAPGRARSPPPAPERRTMAPHRQRLVLSADVRAHRVRAMAPGMEYILPPFARPPGAERQFFAARDAAHCEEQCLAMPFAACRAGTFVQQGGGAARCWLSAHMRSRSAGVRCVTSCVSFERIDPGHASNDPQRVTLPSRPPPVHSAAAAAAAAASHSSGDLRNTAATAHGMGYWLEKFAHAEAEEQSMGSSATAELHDEAESWAERHSHSS